jgi:protein-tyrosine phosphatase
LPFRELGTDAPHEQAFEQAMTAGDGDVAAVARQYMTDEYVRYPGLAGAQAAVRQMISLLADGRPMLTHCFAGKDRTGFTVAVTLRTAGVDNHAVMTDYLESNAAVPALRDRILESLRKRDDQQTAEIEAFADARLAEEVLGVREVYLEAAFRVLDEEYGSLPEYLRAVGVTDEQVSRLRGNLR